MLVALNCILSGWNKTWRLMKLNFDRSDKLEIDPPRWGFMCLIISASDFATTIRFDLCACFVWASMCNYLRCIYGNSFNVVFSFLNIQHIIMEKWNTDVVFHQLLSKKCRIRGAFLCFVVVTHYAFKCVFLVSRYKRPLIWLLIHVVGSNNA